MYGDAPTIDAPPARRARTAVSPAASADHSSASRPGCDPDLAKAETKAV